MEHVSNEEKARELAIKYCKDIDSSGNEYYNIGCEIACNEAMEWKDEQYNEEKRELLGLVKMLKIDEQNQTIIEDLVAILNS